MKTINILSFVILVTVVVTIIAFLPRAAGQKLSWQVSYDSEGRIAQRIDPSERVTKYAYTPASNGAAQSVTITPPEGASVIWQYDADGRLTTMKDGEGEVVYSYNNRDQLQTVEREGTPEIRYAYDAAGRISELRVGNFYRIAWTYDFLGRISAIETPAGQISYEYQTGLGEVIRSLPNGVKTFWKRQANGELQEITHGYFNKPTDRSYSVLARYSYEYGADGRIATIREQGKQSEINRQYSYDSMGRLIHATGDNGQIYAYEYDKLGNRTKATATGETEQICTYDWAGRLTTVNGTPAEYDRNGNLTQVTLNDKTRQYRYHPDGRLAEVEVDGERVSYKYDGYGRLLKRKTSRGETRFIPDPLSEYWQPLVIDEAKNKRTLVIWDGDSPLALVRDGQVEWLLHDHLGSSRLAIDSNGEVIHTLNYDPFGVPLDKQQNMTPVPAFTGLFWDELVGGYLTLARAFSPAMGSFFQPDPQKYLTMEIPRNLSQFAYCNGDPINLVDLDGAQSRTPVTFNAADRWLDSFFRTLRYYDSRPALYRLYARYNGIEIVELPLNTDPDERDYIILQIFREAYQQTGGDPTAMHIKIKEWRERPGQRPQKFGGSSEKSKSTWRGSVTDHEWKAAENAAYVMRLKQKTLGDLLVDDVHLPKWAVNRLPKGIRERQNNKWLVKQGLMYWQRVHKFGEVTGKAPSASEPRIRAPSASEPRETWLVDTPGTRRWIEWGFDQPRFKQMPSTLPSAASQRTSQRLTDIMMNRIVAAKSSIQKYDISGGDGRVAGPGGFASTDAYAALHDFQSRSNPTPSPVGGVYLGGAGGALDGFGSLKGVQLDANGNLILIGEDDTNIELPSLRLDDMVTVFRSVYLHGEGPTVTIDPNPKDPENSAMIIIHSEATKQTYVGWILYQADRLMKGYGQGVDNITQKDVASAVPGYAEVLDTIYFGSSNPRQSQKKGNWERFWIVPRETNRFQGSSKKLTLFDVPLKLKTQKMKWVGDKLVDDVSGVSSPGAKAFTKWFTSNYDGVATEQYLTPPAESGITKAVPVFAELQRVALMTAIAEKLRDQGVPMPFWMYDYKVPPVPFEKYTPGLEVTKTKQDGNIIRTARIFGGVTLSPDSKSVKTYSTVADVMTAPVRIRDKVNRSIKLADYLDGAVAAAITPVGTIPLKVQAIPHDNRIFKAASIPGANTQVLGPNRLEEVDVVIPVGRDRDIRLTRSFNSFFNPTGLWGQGWSLNLPRLVKARVVLDRKDGEVSYTTGHVLITPLNTLQAHFLNGVPVRSFANPKTPVRDPKSPFRRMAIARPTFLKIDSTRVLKLTNGQEWHFSENGALVAVKDGPQVTVYERGAAGQVTRIVGLLGGQLAGEIKLEYAGDEKLKMAIGRSFDNQQSKSLTVTYDYDDAGRLITVKSEEGKIGYGYDGTRVSAVTWQDKAGSSQPEVLRSFRYNDQGQVLSQNNGSATIVHTISLEPGGVVASSYVEQGGEKENTAETVVTHYDFQMRPIKAVAADGTNTEWIYPATGGVEMTITSPDQQSIKIIDSPDGRKRTLERNGVPWITTEFDEGGRMVNMLENGRSVVTQEWRRDGQLARTETPAQGKFLKYDSQGLLSSVMLHPARAGQRLTEWQQTKLDRDGRPTEVTDYTGVRIQMSYDQSGNLASAVQKAPDGKGNLGYNIERNSEGRVEAVNSSWGNTVYTYDNDGSLQNVNATRGNQSASIKMLDGKVMTMTGFDRGQTVFGYYDDGPATGMPRSIVQPNGLELEYAYNTDGRLSAVTLGTDRRVKLEYDSQGRMVTYAWEQVK